MRQAILAPLELVIALATTVVAVGCSREGLRSAGYRGDAGTATEIVDGPGQGQATSATGGNGGENAQPGGDAPVVVSVSPATVHFGSVEVGRTSSNPSVVTVTNSGATPLSLSPTVSGPFVILDATCNPLPASGTCTISLAFVPVASGEASGTLTVSESVEVGLIGTGVRVGMDYFSMPYEVDLGLVAMGTTVSARVTVSAATSLTDLVCSVYPSNDSSGDNLVTDPTVTCPATLAAGQSCEVGFSYTPATVGAKTGDLVMCMSGGVSRTTRVVATVVAPAKILITPPTRPISVMIGTSNEFTFTVTNSGGITSGLLAATITPPSAGFSVGATTCTAGLASLATCYVTVIFKPTAIGTNTALLAVTDANAPATPAATATLTGVSVGGGPPRQLSGIADFGDVAIGGSSSAHRFTLTNNSDAPTTVVTVATTDRSFQIGDDTCTGQPIAANGECTFTITFSPPANATPGVFSALVTAETSPDVRAFLALKGTALAPSRDGGSN